MVVGWPPTFWPNVLTDSDSTRWWGHRYTISTPFLPDLRSTQKTQQRWGKSEVVAKGVTRTCVLRRLVGTRDFSGAVPRWTLFGFHIIEIRYFRLRCRHQFFSPRLSSTKLITEFKKICNKTRSRHSCVKNCKMVPESNKLVEAEVPSELLLTVRLPSL